MNKLGIILLSFFIVSSIFAQGHVDNAGLCAKIKNQAGCILADQFFKLNEIPTKLKKEVDQKKYFEHLGEILETMGNLIDRVANKSHPYFTSTHILDENINYFFVNRKDVGEIAIGTAPNQTNVCKIQIEYEKKAYVEEFYQVGCTIKKNTWLFVDHFFEMSLEDQALLIIHERLHDIGNYEVNKSVIISITLGLKELFKSYNKYKENFLKKDISDFNGVDSDYYEKMKNMRDALAVIGILDVKDKENFRVHPLGGGLVHKDAKVSKEAFIGPGVNINSGNIVEKDVRMLDTNVCEKHHACYLESSSVAFKSNYPWLINFNYESTFYKKLIKSKFTKRDLESKGSEVVNEAEKNKSIFLVKLLSGSKLIDTKISSHLELQRGSSIVNSEITTKANIYIYDHFTKFINTSKGESFEDVLGYTILNPYSKIENSTFNGDSLKLNSKAKLLNTILNIGQMLILGENSQLNNVKYLGSKSNLFVEDNVSIQNLKVFNMWPVNSGNSCVRPGGDKCQYLRVYNGELRIQKNQGETYNIEHFSQFVFMSNINFTNFSCENSMKVESETFERLMHNNRARHISDFEDLSRLCAQ